MGKCCQGGFLFGNGPTPPPTPGDTVWVSVPLDFTQVQDAAPTNTVPVYSLLADNAILAMALRPTQLWTGGTLSGLTLSVGIAGDERRYMTPMDVFTGPIAGTFFKPSQLFAVENFTAAVDVQLTAESAGGDLDELTQGTAVLWLLISPIQ